LVTRLFAGFFEREGGGTAFSTTGEKLIRFLRFLRRGSLLLGFEDWGVRGGIFFLLGLNETETLAREGRVTSFFVVV
jgi:hypothetical protein